MFMKRLLTVAVTAAAVVFSGAPAQADVSFEGKTITVVVPFKEGGGTDTYARAIVPWFAGNLPGKPKIVVLNKPGGGSVRGANAFQSAKPDGLTLMCSSTSTLINSVFGGKKVKYKVTSWKPVMLNAQGSVYYAVTAQTGVTGKDIGKDIQALQKSKDNLIMAMKNATSAELRLALIADMLGFFPKVVMGLPASKWRKATLRGELNLGYANASTWFKKMGTWVDKGVIAPYMTVGILAPDGTVVRDPVFPNMPSFVEAYKAAHGKMPSGPSFDAYKALLAMGTNASKALVLPPGTPQNIVDTYIKTAKRAFKDPEFSKVLSKKLGDYEASFGDDAANLLKTATDIPEDTKKWLFDWIDRNLHGGKKS
jgi:tripartite-type tricarboxylate transporter receptor subunit TctC